MNAPVLTETVRITDTMGAYLARPDTPDPAPGVLVAMELFGVSAHVRDVCERLAGLGFAALAPDLYHRTDPGVELPADARGRKRGFDLLHRMTRQEVMDDVRAAYDHLAARNAGVAGMVGLSVGGHVAYLAAAELDLPAVAVVYGGWILTSDIPLSRPTPTIDRTPDITGRVLFLVGGDDPIIPPAHRERLTTALTTAGVTHELVTYPGVGHGFLCDRRPAYDDRAATDAWRRITALLQSGDTNPSTSRHDTADQ